VYIEAMRRKRYKRAKLDASGRAIYQRADGTRTADAFELDEQFRVKLNNTPVKQWRSVFAVDTSESRTVPPQPMVQPGHWMLYVREHFMDLLPKLRWWPESQKIEPAYNRTPAELDASKQSFAERSDNDNPARLELLTWLKPFVERKMKSEWDGVQ
jgi:hypothetical protein